MLTLEQRVLAVLVDVWHKLPPIKDQVSIAAIGLDDLGARHGSYDPDTHVLMLSSRLFWGDTPAQISLFDVDGNSPPLKAPFVSRAWHTTAHEIFHAIGAETGLDSTAEWLALSGWVEADDNPEGTGRYYEDRPGWEQGFSSWRYRTGGTWFCRAYSTRSPWEDFADAATHVLLGWTDFAASSNGLAKLKYLRREVWGEHGGMALAAAAQRWRGRLGITVEARRGMRQRARPAVVATDDTDDVEDDIEEAVQSFNEQERRKALVFPWVIRDAQDAKKVLMAAIGPLLLRYYVQTWRAVADESQIPSTGIPGLDGLIVDIQRAASSYVDTTQRVLTRRIAVAQEQGVPEAAVRQVIADVYDQASGFRARHMAVTEAHRVAQAARVAAWRASDTYRFGVWRTAGDAKTCGWCAALEGQRVLLGDAFFTQGETVYDAAGKALALEYADVHTPPLHPVCRCELVPEA